MSGDPSPAKLTDEPSSTTSDSRTEPHVPHTSPQVPPPTPRRPPRPWQEPRPPATTTANTDGHSDGSGHGHRHHTDGATGVTPAHRAHARPGGGRLLLLVCVAQLMVILDITAVNVALPQLADGLHINSSDIGWTVTSYSLIFGSLLLLGGRAADLIGRRRMFLTGLGIFTVASVASALAVSATALFAARAGQGLGAAMLSPAALSIIMATFTEGHERARALGAWGAVGGAGAAVGVLLGGALTSLIGWQAIFLINVPVGLALAVTAIKIVPADAGRPQWRGTRRSRRGPGHRKPRGDRVRTLTGDRRRLDLAADPRDRRGRHPRSDRLCRGRDADGPAAAADPAPRRSRRGRRLRDDAGRLGRALRNLPALIAVHAGRPRRGRHGDGPGFPAARHRDRRRRARRKSCRDPRRRSHPHGVRLRRNRRRDAAPFGRRSPRQLSQPTCCPE